MNQIANRQNTISTSLQVTHDRELSIVVAGYQNALIGNELEREIATDHRSALQNRLVDLNSSLRPAAASQNDRALVAKILASMLAGFQNVRGNPQEIITAYTFHLLDLPVFAIEEACRSVSRGRVDGLNPDFPPSAARLHQVASQACQYWRREERQISEVLNAKVRDEISDEERVRVRQGLSNLAKELRSDNPLEQEKPKHKTPEGPIHISDALKKNLGILPEAAA